MDAGRLLAAAKAAGLPAISAKVRSDDRAGWDVTLDNPTKEQSAALAAFLATFDPSAPEVIEKVTEAEAQALGTSRQVRAFWLWFFRLQNRRDPTDEERDAALAALVQAYKDTPP